MIRMATDSKAQSKQRAGGMLCDALRESLPRCLYADAVIASLYAFSLYDDDDAGSRFLWVDGDDDVQAPLSVCIERAAASGDTSSVREGSEED